MEFTEDFAKIQGLLTNLNSTLGEFASIRYTGGNESKISRIVEDLRHFFIRKKYMRDGKINPKHESKLRKISLFLILNTELSTKSKILNSKNTHLANIFPQFSKCLLSIVALKLGLCQFYSEAIYSFPVETSLELLENCSKCVKKLDPYTILEQTTLLAQAVYFKIYHIRYESSTSIFAPKLLERFCELINNYITPENGQIHTWPSTKFYQYMGITIFEMLKLVKSCFGTYKMERFTASHYQFYSPNEVSECGETLKSSVTLLEECNKNLVSVCQGIVMAVTINVFSAWTECKHNEIQLQQLVGAAAYDTVEILKQFEDLGDLPMVLGSIAIKPTTIEEVIEASDEDEILNNVVVKSEHQVLWFKALLKLGVLKSERIFNTFASLIHLANSEDLLELLILKTEAVKTEFDLKHLLLKRIQEMPAEDSIALTTQYFQKVGFSNIYETEYFDSNLRELFNKLSCADKNEIPFRDISVLVLQNPVKFLKSLLDESLKNLEHLSNIIQIYCFLKSAWSIQGKTNTKNSLFFDMVLNKIRDSALDPTAESCMIALVDDLMKYELLSGNLLDSLVDIIEKSVEKNDWLKSIFVCKMCQVLPSSLLPSDKCNSVILKLGTLSAKIRWQFFTYDKEKVDAVSEIVALIQHYKSVPQDESLKGCLIEEINKLDSKIDQYHLLGNNSDESNIFLEYVSEGFDKNGSSREQLCRLLKVLPKCIPAEWELVAKYLISGDNNPTAVLQLFTDAIMILSEISKKSADDYNSLLYCFQQFCIVTKDIIYSRIQGNEEMEKVFIKNVCRLIKHLPGELHNTIELSLVNMFNLKVLSSMKKDKDFVYQLVSLSHLDICKIICSKMAEV